MIYQEEMIEINLNAPNTPEELQMRFAGNARSGKATTIAVPCKAYETNVDAVNEIAPSSKQQQQLSWPPEAADLEDKPQVRFYAVGPSSYQIFCPLCRQRADTETVQINGVMGQLSCLLSTLSCCFPIFWLSFVYLCLQGRLKSKRLFCNRCGGHLGFYRRPT